MTAIILLRLGQNGHHITDNIFKCILLIENGCILINNWIIFIAQGPIDNKAVLVQEMAWRHLGAKPFP